LKQVSETYHKQSGNWLIFTKAQFVQARTFKKFPLEYTYSIFKKKNPLFVLPSGVIIIWAKCMTGIPKVKFKTKSLV